MGEAGAKSDGEAAAEAEEAKAQEPAGEIELVRKEIASVIGEYIPAEVREDVVEQVMLVAESYRGVLPHPRHFEHFNQVLPGCAERIMRMAEKEQDHRHGRENKVIGAQANYALRAQIIAGGIMLLLIGGAGYSIYKGSVGGVVAFLSLAAVSVVIAFLRGEINWRSDKQDADKSD